MKRGHDAPARAPVLALALSLATGPGWCHGEELGRLFFTPETRAVLERQRELHLENDTRDLGGQPVTINGVVRRSSGRSTVWVNGRAVSDHNSVPGLRIELDPHDAAHLRVGTDLNAPIPLAVGDSLEPDGKAAPPAKGIVIEPTAGRR